MAHLDFAHVRRAVSAVVESGLQLLFPPRCVNCGRTGEHFCAACAQAVEATPHPQCARCGLHQPIVTTRCPNCVQIGESPLLLTRAAALHTTPLREAIHAFKYDGQPELAWLLARYLVATFAQPPWSTLPRAITAVVPVPLHEQRLVERGYNQSELLAAHFCAAVQLPLQPTWLQRVRETRQQVGLGPSERRANVEGAFVARGEVAGQSLLLVDDVYTTGATLRACAHAAMVAGAHAVYGLTLAQPVRRAPNIGEAAPDRECQEQEHELSQPPTEVWWEGEL